MEWEERHSTAESLLSLQPSSWLNIDLVTPAGQKLKYRCRYIGYIEGRYLLVEMPDATKYEKSIRFLQPTIKITVRSIIEGGEGAVIGFIAKLSKVVFTPIKMLVLELPDSIQYLSLRAKDRYQVRIPAILHVNDEKADAMMVDISMLGSRIDVPSKAAFELDEDQQVTLVIDKDATELDLKLSCRLRSIRQKEQYHSYGLEFDKQASESVEKIMGKLVSYRASD